MVNKNSKNITDYKSIEKAIDNPTQLLSLKEEEKDLKVESETVSDELTVRQLKFIELYTGDLLGNGVQAYLEVYDIDTTKPGWYKTACACASRLLSNDKVYNKINEMLEDAGLNDNFVDKQMLFLISQQADLSVKARMIGEYNKIKQRIIEKRELKHSGNVTIGLPNEDE